MNRLKLTGKPVKYPSKLYDLSRDQWFTTTDVDGPCMYVTEYDDINVSCITCSPSLGLVHIRLKRNLAVEKIGPPKEVVF